MLGFKGKFIAADIAECALAVALMTASAFISIPVPFVPLTFQTVVAVLSGLLLGAGKGAVAMSVYMVMGLIGIPVFSGGGQGIYYVLKPSFGYIIGFIFSAVTAGLIAGGRPCSLKRCIAGALAALFVDYLAGIPYCMAAAHLLGVENLAELLITGNLIFLPKDAALCILAAFLARRVNPALCSARSRSDRKR